MNSTKINTIIARAKDILNLIECGELDPVHNHEDMIDIHNFTLEVRRVLPIMENDKRWQSWEAHEACN